MTQKSKKLVYAKAIDNAENESIVNYEGGVVYSDSTVSPAAATCDKNVVNQVDIAFTMLLNDNTLKEIKNGNVTLVKNMDYTVNGSTVIVKKEYFAKQTNGNVTLTFSFYPMGVENNAYLSTAAAAVTVSDSTHRHSMAKTAAKEATCTVAGNSEYWQCSDCKKYFSDENGNTEISLANTILTALGHSYTNYTSDNNATYENDSTKTAKCDRCDETDTLPDSGTKLIDATAPTGEIKISKSSFKEFISNITFGLFWKESQTVTITGTDAGIGMDKIYYLKSEKALEKIAVEALSADRWTEGVSLTLSPDWQGVVYAKITDKSGNALYISSDGLVLDATLPVIAGVTDGGKYCNKATV
ncbi:MAG: X2-like carbohydrate binding domain-containing protein [Hespellia sp.]|nr:X2-like carbohydrate binding domain-containing protein [Hespellia sp.]